MRTPLEQRYFDYLVHPFRNGAPTATTVILARFTSRGLGVGFRLLTREGCGLALAGSNRLFQQTAQTLILGFQIFDLALQPSDLF